MASFAGKRVFDESWLRAAEDGSSAILALPDFERFVYVLSILEGCSDQECSILLGVSPQQIQETRLRALEHFWKH